MGNAITEARDREIKALEEEMKEWVKGKRSHWNYYITTKQDDPADASVLCSIADACEVIKLSAAIQALAANSAR